MAQSVHPDMPAHAYRADIDGLRAIAVLSVVVFHSGAGLLAGGFVGVDVFFVISGYLICSILDAEMASRQFSVARFYERRARRILPALFVMAGVVTLVCYALLMPRDLRVFGVSLGSMAKFTSNSYFYALKSSYFTNGLQQPLLHTWSLAIEEQFYIGFPLVLWLGMKLRDNVNRACLLVLWCTSFCLCCYNSRREPGAAFFLLQDRAWELLTGAILSRFAFLQSPRAWRELAGWSGMIGIVAACMVYSSHTLFPGGKALLPVLGAAGVLWSGQGPTSLARLLAWRPLAGIGKISYSLYLWHWPVFMLVNYALMRSLSSIEICMCLLGAFTLAYCSWRWVEQPARHAHIQQQPLFLLSAMVIMTTVSFGNMLNNQQGLPGRLPAEVARTAMVSNHLLFTACEFRGDGRANAGQLCEIGAADAPLTFAVIGDSLAESLLPGFAAAAKQAGLRGIVLSNPGCLPLLDAYPAQLPDDARDAYVCNQHLRAAFATVRQHPRINSVLLVGRWGVAANATCLGVSAGQDYFLADERTIAPGLEENRRVFARSFELMLSLLQPRKISVIAYIPEQLMDVINARSLQIYLNRPIANADGIPRKMFDTRQAPVHALFDRLEKDQRIHVIDLGARLCGDSRCDSALNGMPVYVDDIHLSSWMAIRLAPLFVPGMSNIQSE